MDRGTDVPQEGVLPAQWLRKAIDEGIVYSRGLPPPDELVQPGSLDLRLGEKAYRLRCSFLPEAEPVGAKLADYAMGEIDLRDGAVFERNRPYLVPLMEEVRLPPELRGKTNPKSSTGRLDIFTRVITDRGHRFDEVPAGYHGQLYLEVVSRSFTIRVKSGLALNQLRLLLGNPRCSDAEVRALHSREPLVMRRGRPSSAGKLALSDGLLLSIDLASAAAKNAVYRAKKNSRLLDLTRTARYDATEFWEPVATEAERRLVLEPEEFYLLLSLEHVVIPPHYAAEMVPYDPTAGELRTHYAGFFDPGFGVRQSTGKQGTRAVLEVRAHDVPFMVEHGQRVCKLQFERMSESPTVLYGPAVGSSYADQELTLSKHFRPHRRGTVDASGAQMALEVEDGS